MENEKEKIVKPNVLLEKKMNDKLNKALQHVADIHKMAQIENSLHSLSHKRQ